MEAGDLKGISVLIPVREEEGIEEVIEELAVLRDPLEEILVIYDDEEDPTPEKARKKAESLRIPLRLIRNEGKGPLSAVMTGVRSARAPYIVVMMGDGHDDPSTLPRMLEVAQRRGAVIVGGNRYYGSFSPQDLKELLSYLGNRILLKWKKLPLQDITNNYRLYRRDFLLSHPPRIREGWALGMDLTLSALREGKIVCEVPTTPRRRRYGRSKFRLFRWLPIYLILALELLFTELPPPRSSSSS
jgi:glycosyltransferase involved in cell wall biosynthesis